MEHRPRSGVVNRGRRGRSVRGTWYKVDHLLVIRSICKANCRCSGRRVRIVGSGGQMKAQRTSVLCILFPVHGLEVDRLVV